MTPERWRQIRELFERALAQDPASRSQMLAEACRDDPTLLRDVDSLLAAHEDETGFLKSAPRARFYPEPLIGCAAGHYQILSTLGMGGMGIVYRAFDTHLDRYIALKVLPPEGMTEATREAFVREAKAASALNHPNIVTIHDTGSAGEIHFIAMELIPGKTLAELIREGNGLPVSQALDYAIQIAGALAAAHAAGIVHRDIKPGNIMVTDPGNGQPSLAKILDFGLVTRGESEIGLVRGTVAYMSPEQAAGKAADSRSDLFSFGCTFYEMLTGRRAFPDADDPEILARIPAACRTLIGKCLQRDPAKRVRTAQEVVAALRSIQQKMVSRGRRIRFFLAVAGVAALAVIGAVSLSRNPRLPDAGQWTQLTRLPDSVSQPSLSPDGRRLTFVRGAGTFAGAGQIYVKALPDGEPLQLTHDNLQKMSPVFSPDASQIAYTTVNRENQWDTWTVSSAGGEPRQWLANASGLVWFGKHNILFSEIKNHDVHMAIVAADDTRSAGHDVYAPADVRGMAHRSYPSADHKWVLLVEMDTKAAWLPCRLVPMDGHSPGRPVGPSGAGCTFAAWSPDGKSMYFSSAVGGTFHTWRQRFPGGKLEQITSGPTEEEGVAMAPDGRSFITSVGLRQSPVWVHDAVGERQVSNEGYSFDPKLTPDGKRLCYRILKGISVAGDPSELKMLELDTGRSQTLLPGMPLIGGHGLVYDISPDGRQVVAGEPGRNGHLRLWLAAIDGSSPPRQIPNVEGTEPLFEPGGDILFRGVDGLVKRVRPDGTALRTVVAEPISQRGAISPDGRWLCVRLIGAGGSLGKAYSLEGRASVQLFPTGSVGVYPKWSADGRWIFISVPGSMFFEHGGRTYAVPLPAGKMLPDIPAGGFQSEAQVAGLPSARRIDAFDVSPGPTPEVYAFARETLLRNLYRIPIP